MRKEYHKLVCDFIIYGTLCMKYTAITRYHLNEFCDIIGYQSFSMYRLLEF